jgi:hypothetical protein
MYQKPSVARRTAISDHYVWNGRFIKVWRLLPGSFGRVEAEVDLQVLRDSTG